MISKPRQTEISTLFLPSVPKNIRLMGYAFSTLKISNLDFFFLEIIFFLFLGTRKLGVAKCTLYLFNARIKLRSRQKMKQNSWNLCIGF